MTAKIPTWRLAEMFQRNTDKPTVYDMFGDEVRPMTKYEIGLAKHELRTKAARAAARVERLEREWALERNAIIRAERDKRAVEAQARLRSANQGIAEIAVAMRQMRAA